MLIWMLIGLGGLGFALVCVGWCGRCVGDHPTCRRCGFDLFGSPDDGETCPECGANLIKKGVRIGHHRRRHGSLVAGVVILMVVSLLLGAGVWMSSSKASFYAKVPTFYLVWVVVDADARDALHTRFQQGGLTSGQAKILADAALDAQGDLNKTWDDTWGMLIEDAWTMGALDASQQERYCLQGVNYQQLEFRIRPKVQLGRTPVGYAVSTGKGRVGPNTKIKIVLGLESLEVAGEALPVKANLKKQATKLNFSSSGWGSSSSHLILTGAGDRLGVVSIEARYTVKLSGVVTGGVSYGFEGPALHLPAKIEVVEGRTGDYVVGTQALAERAKNARVWLEKDTKLGVVLLVFAVDNSPEYLNEVRGWFRIGDEMVSANNWTHTGSWSSDHDGHHFSQKWRLDKMKEKYKDVTHVDLVARFDMRYAETGARVKPIWLGEWEFCDIPLEGQVHTQGRYGSVNPKPESLVPVQVREMTIEEMERSAGG